MDGGRNHDTVTVVDSPDAFLGGRGIRQEVVDALRCLEIPTADAFQYMTEGRAQALRDAEVVEILLHNFPCVAHGGVAVADVGGVWGWNAALCHGVGGAEDGVEAA